MEDYLILKHLKPVVVIQKGSKKYIEENPLETKMIEKSGISIKTIKKSIRNKTDIKKAKVLGLNNTTIKLKEIGRESIKFNSTQESKNRSKQSHNDSTWQYFPALPETKEEMYEMSEDQHLINEFNTFQSIENQQDPEEELFVSNPFLVNGNNASSRNLMKENSNEERSLSRTSVDNCQVIQETKKKELSPQV